MSDIPFLVFHSPGRDDKNEIFVIKALIWLKPNKNLCANINIHCSEQLPEGGYSDVTSSFINKDIILCVYDWGLEENRENIFSV